jgi:hypothetical protein
MEVIILTMGFKTIYITWNFKLLVSFCLRAHLFSVIVKFSWPHRASKRRCLIKFSEGPTVTLDTDDTTFTLFSVIPHHFFKFKCTAWLLCRSTYVLFTPPQLSWQPNPFVILCCFVRKASLLLFRFAIRSYSRIKCFRLNTPTLINDVCLVANCR